jgi:hypothetical protein
MKVRSSLSGWHTTKVGITSIMLLTLLVWVFLSTLPFSNSLSQGSERSIQLLESYQNDPLSISGDT